MQLFTDLQPLRRDLGNGNRLKFNAALTSLILSQVERVLDAEVKWQNRSISYRQEVQMREVHNLAAGMKQAIASLKKSATDARAQLDLEMTRATDNVGKVHSVVSDLKAANIEVETFLGDTGSNFPSSGGLVTPSTPADINGVTVNPGATK